MWLLSEEIDLAERATKLLDIVGLTWLHNGLTEFLHTFGVGREAAEWSTWMIIMFGVFILVGWIFAPTNTTTTTNNNGNNQSK